MIKAEQPRIASAAVPRYVAYAYAYPHKTAYRHLSPSISLRNAWACEDKGALFLYVHLPFCEMRCGFCNLFTLAYPQENMVAAYLRTLETEAQHTSDALGPGTFARMAIGGGTPTFLDTPQLDRLFDVVNKEFSLRPGGVPLSVETSPRTATPEKMQLFKRRGVTRVSIGVQSFIESEVAACGRAQRNREVCTAIDNIRAAGLSTLNLDLIYGLPGQTISSWCESVRVALSFCPEEIYLYPLYVRPLTGISSRESNAEDVRPACYAAGREMLLAAGYRQLSMRLFRSLRAPEGESLAYCCQSDGMVGIGCGARSYTRGLHYSREFAVRRGGVMSILHNYIVRTPEAFNLIDYGCHLGATEQRRRYVIKSVLRVDGMSLSAYRERFGTEAFADIPELEELVGEEFLRSEGDVLCPTQKGIDYSDFIGPRLFSPVMWRAMEAFAWR